MNTVDKLLLGSQTLNRKSGEIDQVVKALTGPLKDHFFESFVVRVHHDTFWRVTYRPGEKPFLRYIEEWQEGEGGGSEVVMYVSDRPTHAWHIEKVHCALNALVEAMFDRIPAVKVTLRPVLAAAGNS